MKVCLLLIGIIMLCAGSFYFLSEDKIREELEVNIEYTPSQNLAIMEGRFSDARESIEKDFRMANDKNLYIN